MKVAIALALAGILITGCSDSSTESAVSNDTGNGSSSDQSDSHTSTGSNSGNQAGGDNDSGGASDSGNTGSGSAGSGGADSGESTGGDSDDSATAATCVSTDVGIAFQGINATVVSDPDASPSELIDGCVDRAHSWSGDKGSIVTLDAGAVHQMQGVYIWSTFARMEWLRIESSADGLSWATDWKEIPTKPVSGPVYYPLAEAGSKRYVRVTGFGSDLNDWTNIAEVRWSLSGYSVQGDTIKRFDSYASFGESSPVFEGLSARLFLTSVFPYEKCDVDFGTVVNATGSLGGFHKMVSVNGADQHLIDWNHYPLGRWNMTVGTFPETYLMLDAASASAYDQTTTQESSCLSSGLRDTLWYFDEAVDQARN